MFNVLLAGVAFLYAVDWGDPAWVIGLLLAALALGGLLWKAIKEAVNSQEQVQRIPALEKRIDELTADLRLVENDVKWLKQLNGKG